MGRRLLDMTGMVIGRLTVLRRGTAAAGVSSWICRCECGAEKEIAANVLKKGTTKSCGCLNSEMSAIRLSQQRRTHGRSHTRLYNIWMGMRRRCTEPRFQMYRYYGGRGIRVCEAWNSASAFLDWALANGYRDDLQIDRIDTNGNYEPSNCRWVTPKENANNRRTKAARASA